MTMPRVTAFWIKRWGLLALLCLLGVGWGLWVHIQAEGSRGEEARLERAIDGARAESLSLRRTLAETAPLAEAWERAWTSGDFAPLDRRALSASAPWLADNWRVSLEGYDLSPRVREEVVPGLTRESHTLRLSGSAFLDGDVLGYLETLSQGGRLDSLSIWRDRPVTGPRLEGLRAGAPLPLLGLTASLSWDRWSWREAPGPAPEEADGTAWSPPMESLLLASGEEAGKITEALRKGPWGRAPGWRDLEDLTLTGLVYAGPENWMLWLNGYPVEGERASPHVAITGVETEGAALTVDRGPEDRVEIFLKPSWTYRVFENRMERLP